jgi:hypothetical protein
MTGFMKTVSGRKKFKKENFWKPCHDAKSTVWIWACTLKSDNKTKNSDQK